MSLRSTAIALSALALFGCGDPLSSDDDLGNWPAASLVARRTVTLSDTGAREHISIIAQFYRENFRTVTVERVLYRDQEMPLDDDNPDFVRYAIEQEGSDLGIPFDGRAQTFAVWGANGIASFRDSVIAPSVPGILAPRAGDTVDYRRDLVIRWTPDTVTFERELELEVFVGMTRRGIPTEIRASVPDDGSFTIPAATLERADPGTIRIHLSRATGRYRNSTDGRGISLSVSSSVRLDLVVP
jgi:hypothetical protein